MTGLRPGYRLGRLTLIWAPAVMPTKPPAATLTLVFVHFWVPDRTRPGVDKHAKPAQGDVPALLKAWTRKHW